jgi:tetratricopeptide (TPR) repeat protein
MYDAAVLPGLRRCAAGATGAAAIAALALQLVSRSAFAAGPERGDATVASSTDAPGRLAQPSAQDLADRAYDLYVAGDYAASIAAYLKAYDASNAAVTLLNIATIYDRKLHERDLAGEYYRRYLRAPDAEPDLVQKAAGRLTALKQGEAKPAEPPAGPLRPTPPSMAPMAQATVADAGDAPGRPGALRTAGVILVAAGLTSLGVSLVLGLLAHGKNDDANALCNGNVCNDPEGVTLAHQAGTLATASTVAFCASIGLAGGGLAMILLAPRAPDSRAPRLAMGPSLGSHGAGLSLGGAF